jgi:hypothetical protein
MDQLKKICNVKIWLIILAIIHTVVGVLAPLDPHSDAQLEITGVFLAISVYLLYAAFGTSGQEQARWATVLCGPIWVWFVVCGALELQGVGNNSWSLSPELIPPLVVWGMTALSGILHWNMDEAAPAEA